MNNTLNWLKAECEGDPLVEKWLLCDRLRSAQTWKDRINLSGTPTINLHCHTIGSMALSVAGAVLSSHQLTFLSKDMSIALTQDILVELQSADRLRYFQSKSHVESIAGLLARSFHDLRLALVTPDQLTRSTIEPQAKATDLKLLYSIYCDAIRDRCLADLASTIVLAIQQFESGEFKLPRDLKILIPYELRLAPVEQRFLRQLATGLTVKEPSDRLTPVATRAFVTQIAQQRGNAFCYSVGYGPVNEVRCALQRILAGRIQTCIQFDPSSTGQPQNQQTAEQGLPEYPMKLDDVEFAYTDPVYAPLIYECLSGSMERLYSAGLPRRQEPSVPVTFADGLPAVYARPGRALRAWLRWQRADFMQSKAVQMIREGLLQRSESAEEIGYSRLASNLRALNIGFGRERYVKLLELAVKQAAELKSAYIKRCQEDPDADENRTPRDYGLPALNGLLEIFTSLLRVTPTNSDSASQVLVKAQRFLLHNARCESRLDRQARTALLDAIDAKAQSLEIASQSRAAIMSWLEELSLQTSVLTSGPQPGCIHVCSIADAGITGRHLVCVLGLDESRFPKSALVDPVLLDRDRQQISTDLKTTEDRSREEGEALVRLASRVLETADSRLHLSFSSRDLIENRNLSPSPALVDLYRLTQNRPQSHLDDLLNHMGSPVSFIGVSSRDWLDRGEKLIAELILQKDSELRMETLEQHFKHLAAGSYAEQQREFSEFTAYDGFVPAAGRVLSPTGPDVHVSPSRLEAFGSCPRKFFFRYGLGVAPPDQWNVDAEQWLGPIELGSLIHILFEEFMRDLTSRDQVPNLQRDLPRLLELLEKHVRIFEDEYPCLSRDARDRQYEELQEVCRIFLREEENYCQSTGARPWVLEASIGTELELSSKPRSPLNCVEPVPLSLPNGHVIRLAGRLDRVDRVAAPGNQNYLIWDYKSGSNFGFKQDNPFNEGRKLQSFLYVGMLRHRLANTNAETATSISFGYFFPSTKTEGQRILWTSAELKGGNTILQQICDMIVSGVFPATTNKEDCTFCEFGYVCGDPGFVSQESIRKSLATVNQKRLEDWIKLRSDTIQKATP